LKKESEKMEKLIDEKTVQELKTQFSSQLKDPVDVKLFTSMIITDPNNPDAVEINRFALELVKELHDIDPRIMLQELTLESEIAKKEGIKTAPTALIGYDMGYRIIYNGAPLGHEASSFIESIILVSAGTSGLSPESVKLLSNIKKSFSMQVFVTPTCPYCPKAVIQANQIAVQLRGIATAECVESMENQDMARKFGVSSVPHQVINMDPKTSTVGVQPERAYILQLLKAAAPEDYDRVLAELGAEKNEKEKLPDSPEAPVYLTDSNFDEALKKYPNLAVDFWAEWCMPCKMLSPMLDEIASEYRSSLVVGKLNVDENPSIAARYGIVSIPAVYFFGSGEKTGESVGAVPKAQLIERIKSALKI
jgi:thioredoxin